MQTKKVEFNKSNTRLDQVRNMTREDFVENHGSGTLRKNNRIGLKSASQYWEERICYEFGWEFLMLPATRVTVGEAMTEGDVKGLTELGWFAERFMNTRVFPEDIVKPAFIQYEDTEGNRFEGNGIVLEQTSFNIPDGKIVFAIITEYDVKKEEWLEAVNPF